MADAPNDYRAPYWSDLAATTEQKLGLPDGLLASIVQNGERSNNDQVSSAGARTPFQITPATRKAALEQYGIDAYLSPQNAAEVSGRLLKDSLARNNNDVTAAVGEYHGGTDRANWGAKTQAYIQRVLGNGADSGAPASTFDKLRAQQAANTAPSIANVYAAYRDGKMSPEDAAAFEQEVQAGTIMLPRGATLKPGAGAAPNVNPDLSTPAQPAAAGAQASGAAATPVPPAMLAAYKSGQMSQQDRQDFEALVRNGEFSLPSGAELGTPDVQHPDLIDRAKALPGAIEEAVTGAQRRTAATDALPDWGAMPELNSFSMKSFKAGLGTMMTGPEETAQIIKSQFPGVQVSRDEKGNYLLQSSIDGQTYAIKPGLQVSDIPRGVGAVAAFTPAGRAVTLPGMMAAGAATQAAIEGTQAATGGSFDPGQVAVAGALPAAVAGIGAVARAAATPARAVLGRVIPGAAAETPAAAATEGALADAADASPGPQPVAQDAATAAPATPVQAVDAGAPQAAAESTPVPSAAGAPAATSTQQAGDLDQQIAQMEQRYQELLPQTSGTAPAGAIREARAQLNALQQAPVDTSDAAVRTVAKQIQSVRGVSYKDALSQAKRQVTDQASDYQAKIDRLQGLIEDNRTAARATQELHDIGNSLSQLRSKRATLPDPPGAQAVSADAGMAVPPAAPAANSAPTYADQAAAPGQVDLPAPVDAPPGPIAPAASPARPQSAMPMSGDQLAATAKQAANGSNDARAILAQQAAPDQKVLAAAKRLGIEDYLQPDHVTTNQAYRELAQAVKSVPGSTARASELEGLGNVAQRADKLVDEIGGTTDYSSLSADVKKQLQDTHDELFQKANGLYDQVRTAIPATADAPAPNVLSMIQQRADELQGVKNLSPAERMILSKLTPKTVTTTEEVPGNPLMPGAQAGGTRTVQTVQQPTYALLDDVRRDLTAALYKNRGPFKDTDQALIARLQGALRQDQEAVAQRYGMGDTWNLAQQTASVYKGLQNDLTSLFGKNLDGSLVGGIQLGVKRLAAGDVSSFVKLLKSIPEGMRPQVVASGLNTAFGKAVNRGAISFPAYANWYEGLLRNKQAYTALMANLPQAARKQLSDLYRVSRSISLASKERIATGRLQVVAEQIKGADSLLEKFYDAAHHSAVGGTVAAVVSHIPIIGHGLALAIASALTPAKPAAIKAVDELIASPEFTQLAKSIGTSAQTEAVSRLAYSKEFTKFMRSLGATRDITNRERWIVDALEASHESNSNQKN